LAWRSTSSIAAKNFAALCYLVERHGRLVTKDELLDNVWQQRCVDESVLKVCINEFDGRCAYAFIYRNLGG
jgi:DNA-binding winged helix-turn-helix (wHTH) protein